MEMNEPTTNLDVQLELDASQESQPEQETKPDQPEPVTLELAVDLVMDGPWPFYGIELPGDIVIPIDVAKSLPGYLDAEGEFDETEEGVHVVIPKKVILHRRIFMDAMHRYAEHRRVEAEAKSAAKSALGKLLRNLAGSNVVAVHIDG